MATWQSGSTQNELYGQLAIMAMKNIDSDSRQLAITWAITAVKNNYSHRQTKGTIRSETLFRFLGF